MSTCSTQSMNENNVGRWSRFGFMEDCQTKRIRKAVACAVLALPVQVLSTLMVKWSIKGREVMLEWVCRMER